jgi:hypothetical protein
MLTLAISNKLGYQKLTLAKNYEQDATPLISKLKQLTIEY